jgi:hypothetical protein
MQLVPDENPMTIVSISDHGTLFFMMVTTCGFYFVCTGDKNTHNLKTHQQHAGRFTRLKPILHLPGDTSSSGI